MQKKKIRRGPGCCGVSGSSHWSYWSSAATWRSATVTLGGMDHRPAAVEQSYSNRERVQNVYFPLCCRWFTIRITALEYRLYTRYMYICMYVQYIYKGESGVR